MTVEGPVARVAGARDPAGLPMFAARAVDPEAARAEDGQRDAQGLPPRYALPQAVQLTPETAGLWERLDGGSWLWRLRITAPGASSVNLGFTGYRLPAQARLTIHPVDLNGPDDPRGVRVFTAADNEAHGELWTPVVVADDIVVELLLPPASRHDYRLELTSINRGYRFFDEVLAELGPDKAGACNVDVACPEGDPWRGEIAAVAAISAGGSIFCTGFMVNNTAQDGTPYFMTANHCNIRMNNAASLVVYWNFQSPACGQQGGGSLADFQTGSTYLTASATSDFTLVLLDDPVDPDHNVAFAGWDATGADATAATAIHHPGADEKSISFEHDATTITSYLGTAVPGDETHVRVVDWDVGTTEPGSSGSPLFDQNHRVIGQLHGGYAACGNNESDWYGRLAVSWSWLDFFLDPAGTGAKTLDTWVPYASGLELPPGGLRAGGPIGGPFTAPAKTWTVTNPHDVPCDYVATVDVPWVDLIVAVGTLPPGGSVGITATLNAAAGTLPYGDYQGSLTLTTYKDGERSATRPLSLSVGQREIQLAFPLDDDPGWQTDPGWAWGVPAGGGGMPNGNPDPASGFTGTHVYGFELSGDYPPILPASHLTTTAIDCRDLTQVSLRFRRWLNVESGDYDVAAIAVSNDGEQWQEVWHNVDEVTDGQWAAVAYDLSAVADGAATVFVRWTMGPTDFDWQYSGWNIDDVEIWGRRAPLADAGGVPGPRVAVGNHPNPFNPETRITFTIDREGPVTLAVYDLRGRLVRRLLAASLPAGEHGADWDGADEAGRRAGSGIYLARLVSGGRVVHHKMTMLK